MPSRTQKNRVEAKRGSSGGAGRNPVQKLKTVAQSTLLAAGLAAARLMAEADVDAAEGKLFSPGLVDRLRAPITRYHE
jgi:hypothetical protein